MSGPAFPQCWLFGLPHPNTRCTGCEVGQGLGVKVAVSRLLMSIPPYLAASVSHSHPFLPLGTLPRPACRSGPGFYVTAFPQGPGAYKTLRASSKMEFPFPPVLWRTVIKPQWPSKPNAAPPIARPPPPQAGMPDTGLRTLLPVGETLQCSYFPVSGLPTHWV